jgi:hypothetical protein
LLGFPLKFNRNPWALKGNPLNLPRKSIEFGEAALRNCNEFLLYLIEINRFFKATY